LLLQKQYVKIEHGEFYQEAHHEDLGDLQGLYILG